MNITVAPGKYVVAVSGGIDSVVLLDLLRKNKSLDLMVAHFDHGIRPDSAQDAEFTGKLAHDYGLPYFSERAELGEAASEALARKHRYEFLHRIRKQMAANAIITAHHQDDVIETALLNVLRGTKRRGFVSLKDTQYIKRPLLKITKDELKEYARQHNLHWCEDSTNQDTRFKRNEIRALIKNSLTPDSRQELAKLLDAIHAYDQEIEALVNDYLSRYGSSEMDRLELNSLGDLEANELIAGWLRRNKVGFDKAAVKRILEGSRSLGNGAQIDVQAGYYCRLSRDKIILNRRESV